MGKKETQWEKRSKKKKKPTRDLRTKRKGEKGKTAKKKRTKGVKQSRGEIAGGSRADAHRILMLVESRGWK